MLPAENRYTAGGGGTLTGAIAIGAPTKRQDGGQDAGQVLLEGCGAYAGGQGGLRLVKT
jgi:hypothetical protein